MMMSMRKCARFGGGWYETTQIDVNVLIGFQRARFVLLFRLVSPPIPPTRQQAATHQTVYRARARLLTLRAMRCFNFSCEPNRLRFAFACPCARIIIIVTLRVVVTFVC